MMWESSTITLACGCLGNLPWIEPMVGTDATCSSHGETEVEKASRIYEAKTTRSSLTDFTVGKEV